MSLAVDIMEKVNLGSVNGVVASLAFTTSADDGESFLPADVGLIQISSLLPEPKFDPDDTDAVFSVAYDRTNNKVVLTLAGVEAAGDTATVRVHAIGR